jgi:peptidoglycan/LPS O-acetylase OafA/YrhL
VERVDRPLARKAPTVQKLGYRADIQGLRAVAVGLVVLYHAGVPWLPGGYVGVDAFFVISGFLITTHLLESLDRDSRISFPRFYARRARRILPASLFVAAATLVAAYLFMSPLQMKSIVGDAIATALYGPNIRFANLGTDYLAETAPSVFQHYWSLGVEEQFYLLWPAILALGFLITRSSRRGLFWLTAVLVVGSFAACLVVAETSQPWAFFSPPTRAWELGVGGLVAFFLRSSLKDSTPRWVGWVGLGGLLAVSVWFSDVTPFPAPYAAIPVVATALIIVGAAGGGRGSVASVLSVTPLVWVGKLSYSIYLVHWPLLVIPAAVLAGVTVLPPWATLSLGLASIPVAYLVYRFIEKPAMTTRVRVLGRPRYVLLAAVLGSVTVLVLANGIGYASARAPLTSYTIADEFTVEALPVGNTTVPSNVKPTLRSASQSVSPLYGDGCHRQFESVDSSGCTFGSNDDAPVVVLFGDSHAAQWFPALAPLAESGSIQLVTYTKSSCPSVAVPAIMNGAPYTECEQWRGEVTDAIAAMKDATVIVANYGGNIGTEALPEDVWFAGIEKTVSELAAQSKVYVLADTPDIGSTPALCLSVNLDSADRCSGDRDAVLSSDIKSVELAATKSNGGTYVDTSDFICNNVTCPVVIDNLLVYRDAHHLTVEFSKALAPELTWLVGLGGE